MKLAFNKIILVLLSTLMVLAIAMPISAQDTGPKPSLTINKLEEGDTVTAYKVINAVYDKGGKFDYFEWNDNFIEKIKELENVANGNQYIENFDKDPNSKKVALAFSELHNNGPEIKKFSLEIASFISMNNNIQSNFRKIVGASENNVVIPSDKVQKHDGAYIIFINGNGGRIFNPIFYPLTIDDPGITGNETIIDAKCETVTLSKLVSDDGNTFGKTASVGIGDEITYKVTFQVPDYVDSNPSKIVKLSDTPKNGITLGDVKDVSILTANNENVSEFFDVNISDTNLGITLKANDAYGNLNVKLNAANSRELTVTYKAKVNDNASEDVIVDNVVNNMTNEVTYEFNSQQYINDPKQLKDSTTLHTYGINLTKKAYYGTDKKSEVSPIGAIFKIYKGETTTNDPLVFSKTENGVETVYKLLEDQNSNVDNTKNYYNEIKVSKNDEKIKIEGLDTGKYTIKEIKAPDGNFVIPLKPETIINLADSDINGELDDIDQDNRNSATGTNVGSSKINDTNLNEFDVQIDNFMGEFNIPNTGSTGTMVFTVGGMLLMAGALVVIIISTRNRKNRQ